MTGIGLGVFYRWGYRVCREDCTFDASSDEEEAVVVLFAQVSRMQPALSVQGVLGLVGLV